jgi:hypothetical protein
LRCRTSAPMEEREASREKSYKPVYIESIAPVS